MMLDESKFRVFISYSHKNDHAFQEVKKILTALGLLVWSDQNLDLGRGFTEQIQTTIEHSHLFVPILTPESHERGWVHQEIGFAVARKVPCVAICLGWRPEGMIATAHAIVLSGELHVTELENRLRQMKCDQLVTDAATWGAPSDRAQEPEQRAQAIKRYADEAFAYFDPCCVRLQSGLSSFSIPNVPPDKPVWKARYGSNSRSVYSCDCLRGERVALEKHARTGGLRMVMNAGVDLDKTLGPGAKRTRLCILTQFLDSLKGAEDRVRIALVSQDDPLEQFVSVGNWFTAESSASRPVRGVVHTTFTSHAPTVSRRIREFDEELDRLLAHQHVAAEESLTRAIEQLREMITTLPRHPAWSCEG